MFNNADLKQLVKRASRALESEDRHLADCFKVHGWKGHEHGICENQSEKYYQFVIWSELMSSFRWRTRTEYDKWDFVFFDNETDKPVAYAEIKLHFNFEGILRDMDRLAEMRKPGVMLILTCWQTEDAKGNCDLFARRLQVRPSDMEIATFPISGDWTDEEWEFAVIGFLVTPHAIPASA